MRECKKIDIPHISLLDKLEVKEWFKGMKESATDELDSEASEPQKKKIEN
jgi:hypothetical protein